MSELAILKKAYDNPFIQRMFLCLSQRVRGDFGLLHALIYARSIDFYTRYRSIVTRLPPFSSVLDVGGGKIGIGAFLDSQHSVICLDLDPEIVKTAIGQRVVASAEALPFRSHSIATTISVDCLEHLPRHIRPAFMEEMKRVARERVLLHTPVHEFSWNTDLRFYQTHRRLFRSVDKAHAEHLKYVLPYTKELTETFPEAQIISDQNCSITYILFVIQRIPIFGWLTGFLYLLFLKRLHDNPPFYGVLVVWRVPG